VVKKYEEMTPKSKKKLSFFPDPLDTSDKIILFKNDFYMFLGKKKSKNVLDFRFFLPWEKKNQCFLTLVCVAKQIMLYLFVG